MSDGRERQAIPVIVHEVVAPPSGPVASPRIVTPVLNADDALAVGLFLSATAGAYEHAVKQGAHICEVTRSTLEKVTRVARQMLSAVHLETKA